MASYPSHNRDVSYIKALQRLHELMPGSLGVQDNNGDTPAVGAASNGHVEVLQCVHDP